MRLLGVHHFIAHVEALLDPVLCAEIVKRFQNDPRVREGEVFHSDRGAERNSDKVSRDLLIPSDGEWSGVCRRVHEAVVAALEEIVPHFPSLQVYPLVGTGYKIQMYPRGCGRFAWHFDALGPRTQSRILALVLYLNDVREGGETAFHYQGIEVVPRTGYGIFFPTAWTHMHCSKVPESGDKFVISSFFSFQIEV